MLAIVHTPSVEAFCRELLGTRDRLDFIVTNPANVFRDVSYRPVRVEERYDERDDPVLRPRRRVRRGEVVGRSVAVTVDPLE